MCFLAKARAKSQFGLPKTPRRPHSILIMLERDMSDIIDPFSPRRYCAVTLIQLPSHPNARLAEPSKRSRKGARRAQDLMGWHGTGCQSSPMVLAKLFVQAYELA